MASKVLVKLPTAPLPQGKNAPSETMPLTERNEGSSQMRHQGMNVDRVAQLEQNMKFLQKQHQATLTALHKEVEALRKKNTDLQFQLVFSKGSSVSSSPSSPEENGTECMKSKVKLLEEDLLNTKISLDRTRAEKEYFYDTMERLKKKLQSLEKQNEKPVTVNEGVQVGGKSDSVHAALVADLKLAEVMVKQLRRQKEEQRKEIAKLKASLAHGNGTANKGGRSREGNNSHHSRGSPTSATQDQASHKFPPLMSQSYWHRRPPRNGRSRQDKQEHQTETDSAVLPQLQENSNAKTDTVVFESPFYRSRGYRNNYREESNRKYRGQMSQRDRSDGDHYHPRHNYKDRNSKDHPREHTNDSAEGSRNADTSAGSKS